MDPRHSIAVCTTTFYPKWFGGTARVDELCVQGDRSIAESKVRGDLALETATAVLRAGYRLILINEGGNEFQAELKRRGIPFIQSEAGMSGKRRQAFQEAINDPAIDAYVWTEPEKVDLIASIPQMVEPILQDRAAIVVPQRIDMENYPAYQRQSEKKANAQFNQKLHTADLLPTEESLDMYIGPRAFSARAPFRSELFDILMRKYSLTGKNEKKHSKINPENYSNAIYFPVVAALNEGLPIASVPISFRYPDSQRLLEEYPAFVDGPGGYKEKRELQYGGILGELVYYLRYIGRLRKSETTNRLKQGEES